MRILGENYDEYMGFDEYDPYDPFAPGEPDDTPMDNDIELENEDKGVLKMAKKKDTVYVATFYKFGYDLTVAGHTEEEAIESLMKEYVRAFKQYNDGDDPRKERVAGADSSTFYDYAKSDIRVNELEFGEVEWL